MAKLFYPDGRIEEVSPVGRKFTLEELQTLVGGFIQIVPGAGQRGHLVYCDEDGKCKGAEPNPKATEEAIRQGWKRLPGDVLVGCVLFT